MRPPRRVGGQAELPHLLARGRNLGNDQPSCRNDLVCLRMQAGRGDAATCAGRGDVTAVLSGQALPRPRAYGYSDGKRPWTGRQEIASQSQRSKRAPLHSTPHRGRRSQRISGRWHGHRTYRRAARGLARCGCAERTPPAREPRSSRRWMDRAMPARGIRCRRAFDIVMPRKDGARRHGDVVACQARTRTRVPPRRRPGRRRAPPGAGGHHAHGLGQGH
jgi:hypothetical protein